MIISTVHITLIKVQWFILCFVPILCSLFKRQESMGEAQKNDEIGALGFMYILTFWFLAPYHSGLSKGSSVHSVLAIITQMQPTNLSFQFNFCHFLPTSSFDGFFSCHPFHLFVPCYSVTASLLSWNEDLSLVTLEINSWRVNLHRFLSTLFPPP